MDGESTVTCHLQCEIASVTVTGLPTGCSGATNNNNGELFFLRCHVPAGGGQAIQIDSRPAATADGATVSWRDVASLSCDGSPACVRELVERRSVVFEVRRRRRGAALRRRIMGSELMGRAEVAWRDHAAVGVGGEAVERQVALAAPGGGGGGRRAIRGDVLTSTPVLLSVRMTVRVSETAGPAGGGGRRRVMMAESAAHRESGCEWSVGDEAVFALAGCAAEGALE
ncbi:hypothetical protein QOZ80_7BG0609250 [Eleusine coracana subsp. coracana]|nr:hypothetical protein QOZ80_7BG0609250 [Eleusine coracana subsp. coracana]